MDSIYIAIALLVVAIILLPLILVALRNPKSCQDDEAFTEKQLERFTQLRYRYHTTEELYR
jgi:hypothetical protein